MIRCLFPKKLAYPTNNYGFKGTTHLARTKATIQTMEVNSVSMDLETWARQAFPKEILMTMDKTIKLTRIASSTILSTWRRRVSRGLWRTRLRLWGIRIIALSHQICRTPSPTSEYQSFHRFHKKTIKWATIKRRRRFKQIKKAWLLYKGRSIQILVLKIIRRFKCFNRGFILRAPWGDIRIGKT